LSVQRKFAFGNVQGALTAVLQPGASLSTVMVFTDAQKSTESGESVQAGVTERQTP
jgi:hypothetical protein